MPNYVEYDNHKEISRIQADINPVRFITNQVGFYICRLQGYDKAVVMSLDEAEEFIEELQERIDRVKELTNSDGGE